MSRFSSTGVSVRRLGLSASSCGIGVEGLARLRFLDRVGGRGTQHHGVRQAQRQRGSAHPRSPDQRRAAPS